MKFYFFALGFLFFTFAQAESQQRTSASLALNWKAEPEFGGFYAAQVQNQFAHYGLDVKILEGGSGTPTVQMLANGKVDFAIVSADEIILAQDRNPKSKVIALFAIYQQSPYIIMSHSDRGFKTLKEVWTSPGTLTLQSGLPYYQFLVNKWGKPKARIAPYTGGVGAFVNDKKLSQQGFISVEPVLAEKAGIKANTFIIAEEGFNPYLVVLATTEKYLKEHKDVVERVVKATRDGWTAYLKDPSPANKFMATLNKSLDLSTFEKGAELQKPLIEVPSGKKLGFMEADRWKTLAQQLSELGLLKNKPQPAESYFQNF